MAENVKTQENSEIKEKKEKFINAPKKTEKTKKEGFPLYLVGLMLILGILIGIAVMMITQPEQIPINGNDTNTTNPINDLEYKTVGVKVVYSAECENCVNKNTIEDLFNIRGVLYEVERVEANSEEGKELINKFDITYLPTAIVDAEKLKFYQKTNTDFEGNPNIRKVISSFVVPELNLSKEHYFPIMLTEKLGGCNTEKPSVIQFGDYYTELNAKSRSSLYDFLFDFNKSIDFRYSFVEEVSHDENALLANVFLMCASEQDKYIELERQFTSLYCNNPFKGDETILTSPEINGCWTLSDHYGTPLSQIEMDVALGRTSIDTNKFVECVNNQKQVLINAKYTAQELGLNLKGTYPRTGIFLIDCKETTMTSGIKNTLCSNHPELESCSRENNDTAEEQ